MADVRCHQKGNAHFMQNRFNQFMYGRYGNDQLNRFVSVAALVVIIINLFVRIRLLSVIALLLLLIVYLRMFSRNIEKRAAENRVFLRLTDRFRRRIVFRNQNKNYRFFVCPSCRQKVRVPRGKGKIEITCPRCRHSFIKRT